MKKQILFIHGAGPQGPEGSLGLVTYLRKTLGDEYELIYPDMPYPENPSYKLWKLRLQKELAVLDGEVILIGHSLGASVLLKYLSENIFRKPISGLFLVAAPYWGKEDWEIDEYALQEDFSSKLPPIPKIFLYHSREDKWVPFEHLAYYKEKLPEATARALNERGHDFKYGLPELVEDIKSLVRSKELF